MMEKTPMLRKMSAQGADAALIIYIVVKLCENENHSHS
jgi:hypothetical protein